MFNAREPTCLDAGSLVLTSLIDSAACLNASSWSSFGACTQTWAKSGRLPGSGSSQSLQARSL